jgi:pimeloyl-ACP methyl ester carboxylesterase
LKPTLFCIHGYWATPATFTGLKARFEAAGYRVVTPVLPFHDRDPTLPPPPGLGAVTIEDYAGFLVAEIERIAGPVILVGHSMGGMLALELAATAPTRCHSLTLIGSSAMFGSADGSFQRAFLAERLGPLDAGQRLADLAPALVADLCLPTTAPDLIAACVEAMARIDEAAYRAALACLVTFDRRAALAGLTMPVLCLAGEHDRQAPPQGVERMAGKIPGARFLTIRNAAHLMTLEAPEAVTQALGDFIAEGSA